MYDAHEKVKFLKEMQRHLSMCKDDIAGCGFIGMECDLDDLLRDVASEISDLQDDLQREYEEQHREDVRGYEAQIA